MRELNQLNKIVMQKFSSRQSYTFIKGQYVPIILQNISDESQLGIESRKYFIQTYDFTMLGYLIDEEAISEAISTSSIEATRTENLCQWVSALKSPFPYKAFEDLTVQELQILPGAQTVFAIDISVTKRDASLVAAQKREDGTMAVGVIATFHSDQQVDELKIAIEVNEWARKYKPRMICFDKYTSMSVAQRLALSGQKIEDMSGQVFYQACSDLLDAIVNRRLIHNGQDELVNSINSCAAKETDAGWRIVRRKSAGDVTAAIALAMCVHQMNKPQIKPQIIAV